MQQNSQLVFSSECVDQSNDAALATARKDVVVPHVIQRKRMQAFTLSVLVVT